MFTRVGPGLLGGITLSAWLGLLREENFAVDFACFPRAIAITVQSLKNSVLRACEIRRFGPRVKDVVIPPPLFVLGHWRNGTTHLHNLLSVDQRFAFPNTYQVTFPHIFLTSEATDRRFLSFFCPKRRPMDNVAIDLASPQEDEFALCAATLKSPCMTWIFPRSRARFERYLTFRGVNEAEIAEWRAAFELFLKKLTWKHGRPLILKSPPHTGRIRLLLKMFPGAKFVHIHRHPCAVFQSSRRTFRLISNWHGLQRLDSADFDDWVLRQYREMYEAFLEEKKLIPNGSFHELSFEDLEADPVLQIRRVYETLDLPDFQIVEPEIRRYVGTLAGYRKNEFPELSAHLKARIAQEWGFCFQEWGYDVG